MVHGGGERRVGQRRASDREVGSLGHEIRVAILLGLATLGSAWNAYQAARWGGVQAIHYGEANAARARADELVAVAQSQQQIDVATFLEWARAKAEGREDLAVFLEERLRPELAAAFDAWRAETPVADARVGRAVPPGTPFERPEYVLAARERARELDATAVRAVDAAREANNVSTNSVATVVLFAAVLCFTGIGSKLTHRGLRAAMMGLALVFLVVGGVASWRVPRGAGWADVP